jgi:AcrR family transcriptional regulator
MPKKRTINGKKEIIDTAFALIQKDGPEALSARRIAGEMKVSFMTLYNYVHNINEIRKEVILEGFRILYDAAYHALRSEGAEKRSFEEACRLVACAVFHFAEQYRSVYRVMNAAGPSLMRDPELSTFYKLFPHLFGGMELSRRRLYMLELVVTNLIQEKLTGYKDHSRQDFCAYIDEYLEMALEQNANETRR